MALTLAHHTNVRQKCGKESTSNGTAAAAADRPTDDECDTTTPWQKKRSTLVRSRERMSSRHDEEKFAFPSISFLFHFLSLAIRFVRATGEKNEKFAKAYTKFERLTLIYLHKSHLCGWRRYGGGWWPRTHQAIPRIPCEDRHFVGTFHFFHIIFSFLRPRRRRRSAGKLNTICSVLSSNQQQKKKKNKLSPNTHTNAPKNRAIYARNTCLSRFKN